MQLFERCAYARRLTGLSQEALALDLGVTRGAVAQWEMRQGTAPAIENMIALALRSGVCFEWLATDRGPIVHGAPGVRDPDPPEYLPLTAQEVGMLKLFRSASAARRNAVMELLR